ncbi:conserved hypothetical protein [Candida dubliniensis CD36]|uniref:FHA domain-containing protein n=1 Tax=Candida dubliniensis (strain CD36 / ATCC MYA-646 / CBS 7987 / NCPF 3949 / NRRL Y-17841) TaxID=573826 RepID=B9W9D8_CANDC|nr:conserved hypothetical protein [Candida dubliniensis CD36]CAX45419.1 conserved hypothetical protein [Candida dubliniensis CD36]
MSNMNYQFPPSSPVLEDYSYNSSKDPFTSAVTNKSRVAEEATEARVSRDNYPTPNPSSSLFRSSSPAREAYSDNDKDIFKPEPKPTANINKDFNVLNPDKSVIRIPLVNTHSHFSIGRSSRSCEFALTASDPRISRVHLKLSSSSQQIILTCLGSNGVGVIIPKPCFVYETNSSDNFIIMENTSGKPLDADLHNYKLNKTIKLDGHHTEFFVRKGETITMPKFENILLQISKDIILLNPNDIDEELTDEEMPTLLENDNSNTTNTTPMNKTVSSALPKTPLKSVSKTIIKVVENDNEEPDETPSKGQRSENKTFVMFEDNNVPSRSASASPKPPSVLTDKTNIKRKAISEEPQIKKKKKQIKRQQTPELDNSVLELPNLAEIQNILINHLAFSRLSSTPASFLNTISVLTSKLSLAQIRAILHDLKCIGVIHRQGKDAAGQPLQEEYYYMPENDEDRERTTLVSNIKGHGGLRSCRKTHKQYYWKKPAPIKK